MKKATRLNYLLAAITSLISAYSLLSTIIALFLVGLISIGGFAITGFFTADNYDWEMLIAGIATGAGFWIAIPFLITPLIASLVFVILGFIGASKKGNKKPLMIVNLVFGILGVFLDAVVPSIFMIEGSIIGLGVLSEEKEEQQ